MENTLSKLCMGLSLVGASFLSTMNCASAQAQDAKNDKITFKVLQPEERAHIDSMIVNEYVDKNLHTFYRTSVLDSNYNEMMIFGLSKDTTAMTATIIDVNKNGFFEFDETQTVYSGQLKMGKKQAVEVVDNVLNKAGVPSREISFLQASGSLSEPKSKELFKENDLSLTDQQANPYQLAQKKLYDKINKPKN